MNPPISIFIAVANVGGNLSLADRETLRIRLPATCPAELREEIRRHKKALLAVFAGPPFAIIRSELLDPSLVLWTTNEQAKQFLVSHGADPGLVYTREELATLIALAPDPATLRTLHHAKRVIEGRIVR